MNHIVEITLNMVNVNNENIVMLIHKLWNRRCTRCVLC